MSCRSVRNSFSASLRKTTVWHCMGPMLFARQPRGENVVVGRLFQLSAVNPVRHERGGTQSFLCHAQRPAQIQHTTKIATTGARLCHLARTLPEIPPRFQISSLTCLWTKELLCREALQLLLREMPVWKAIGRRPVAHGWQWQRGVSDGGWRVVGKRHPRGRKPKGLTRKVCAR